VSLEGPPQLAGFDVPQAQDPVVTGGQDLLAVGGEGEAGDGVRMGLELPEHLARGRVVQRQPTSRAAAQGPLAVGTEGHSIGGPFPFQAVQFLAVGQVPQAEGAVVAAGQQAVAGAGEGQVLDGLSVSAQAELFAGQTTFDAAHQIAGATAHLRVLAGGRFAEGIQGGLADRVEALAGRLALSEVVAAELADEASNLLGRRFLGHRRPPCRQQQGPQEDAPPYSPVAHHFLPSAPRQAARGSRPTQVPEIRGGPGGPISPFGIGAPLPSPAAPIMAPALADADKHRLLTAAGVQRWCSFLPGKAKERLPHFHYLL
jgi:hypothetical protein